MTIYVKTNGLGPDVPADYEAEDATMVGELIEALGISRGTSMVILVNGRLGHWHHELKPGDHVELIRAIAGG